MRMVPVIALVPDDVIERLQPIVDQVIAGFDLSDQTRKVMVLNGWTPEMIAWGHILKAASTVELEVVKS